MQLSELKICGAATRLSDSNVRPTAVSEGLETAAK
jgi:hypothetical protein